VGLRAKRRLLPEPGLPQAVGLGLPQDLEVLKLGMSASFGTNTNEAEQAAAEERFRTLIEPFVSPERYPDLHRRFPKKTDLQKHVASENATTPRQIRRLLERWGKKGIAGLTRAIRADKGIATSLNKAAQDFILAGALPKGGVYGNLSVRDIYRAYEDERLWRLASATRQLTIVEAQRYRRYVGSKGYLLPEAQLPEASYPSFRRWFNRIPEVVRTLARKGDEAFHNTQEIISFRDLAALKPMEYLVMDHRVLDIFCLVRERKGWKLVRPWLTAALDMRTRKWLAWVIVETPSSDSIAAVLRRVFLDYGLPTACYWDNGKDFRSEWLEGGSWRGERSARIEGLPEKWGGVLESLGVRVHHAIVKRARSKIIEPNFGNIANFDRTLPEYCGHKPGARPERFGKLLDEHEAWLAGKRPNTPFRTIEEIAALYGQLLEKDLNERDHTGEGMGKVTITGRGFMCPNEAWEILIRHVPRRSVSAEILQFCFAKRRDLTVRNGEARTTFSGESFHYRLTGNPVALMALNGRTVELAYDPLDLEDAAIFCDGQFVGLASCIELRRMGEDAFVEDERNRRAARRAAKHFIEAVHEGVPFPSPEAHLSRRREIAPARTVPDRSEVAVTLSPSLAAAVRAAEEEKRFRFESVPMLIEVEKAPEDQDDSTFNFFSDGGTK
jgi:transposase InsO family protein